MAKPGLSRGPCRTTGQIRSRLPTHGYASVLWICAEVLTRNEAPRPALPGPDHRAPEVAVRVGRVRGPVVDQSAARHRLGIGARTAPARGVLVAERPGRCADGVVELRCP